MTYTKRPHHDLPYFENEYARFWIDQNILFFTYNTHVIIDLHAAKTIVADRIRFQKEKHYPVFCDVRGIKEVNKMARDYLAKEGSILIKAVSILVDPPLSRAILDMYLKMSKPSIPTRVFSDKPKAISFLKSFT